MLKTVILSIEAVETAGRDNDDDEEEELAVDEYSAEGVYSSKKLTLLLLLKEVSLSVEPEESLPEEPDKPVLPEE